MRHPAGRHGARLRRGADLRVAGRVRDRRALVGFVNGAGIVLLGLSPIVMTLAMNGILQGAALLYSARHARRLLLAAAALVHDRQACRRHAGRVLHRGFRHRRGDSAVAHAVRPPGLRHRQRRARRALSGIARRSHADRRLCALGLCAALVGVLLTGFSGQASLGMGDDYLLPSIAVVVVGGTLITGGRGHYLGMLGGVLLLDRAADPARRHDASLCDARQSSMALWSWARSWRCASGEPNT